MGSDEGMGAKVKVFSDVICGNEELSASLKLKIQCFLKLHK